MFKLPPMRINLSKSGLDNLKDLLVYSGIKKELLSHLTIGLPQPNGTPEGDYENTFINIKVIPTSKYATAKVTSWDCAYQRVVPLQDQTVMTFPVTIGFSGNPVDVYWNQIKVLRDEVQLYADSDYQLPASRENVIQTQKLVIKAKDNSYCYYGESVIEFTLMLEYQDIIRNKNYFFRPTETNTGEGEPWFNAMLDKEYALASHLPEGGQPSRKDIIYQAMNEANNVFGNIKALNILTSDNSTITNPDTPSFLDTVTLESVNGEQFSYRREVIDVTVPEASGTYQKPGINYPLKYVGQNLSGRFNLVWFDISDIFVFMASKQKTVPEGQLNTINKWWSKLPLEEQGYFARNFYIPDGIFDTVIEKVKEVFSTLSIPFDTYFTIKQVEDNVTPTYRIQAKEGLVGYTCDFLIGERYKEPPPPPPPEPPKKPIITLTEDQPITVINGLHSLEYINTTNR